MCVSDHMDLLSRGIHLKQGATVQTSYIFIDVTNPADLIKTSRVSIGRPNKDWLSLKGVIWSEHI